MSTYHNTPSLWGMDTKAVAILMDFGLKYAISPLEERTMPVSDKSISADMSGGTWHMVEEVRLQRSARISRK